MKKKSLILIMSGNLKWQKLNIFGYRMILISHRGNLEGKNPEKENSPIYVLQALSKGFDVEVDIEPQVEVEVDVGGGFGGGIGSLLSSRISV